MSEKVPLISFIVVARNEEEYICDCLTSIVNQTVDKDIYEIILVDDVLFISNGMIIPLDIPPLSLSNGCKTLAPEVVRRFKNLQNLFEPERDVIEPFY